MPKRKRSSSKHSPATRSKEPSKLRPLVLSLRRLFAFAIDLGLVLLLISVIESAVALWLLFYGGSFIDILAGNADLLIKGGFLHLIVVPLFMGILDSSVFKGRSPGSRMLGLQVISYGSTGISIVACVLRAFAVLGIPYLYFNLVLMPYQAYLAKITQDELHVPFVELTTFLWLCVSAGISALFFNGEATVLDRALGIRVLEKGRKSFSHLQDSTLRLSGWIVTTTIVAFLMSGFLQYSSIADEWLAKTYPIAERFQSNSVSSYVSMMSERTTAVVKRTGFQEQIQASEFALRLTDGPVRRGSVEIPRKTPVPVILVDLNDLSAMKGILAALARELVLAPEFSEFSHFEVILHRYIYIDMFSVDKRTECLLDKQSGVVECINGYEWGSPLFSWSDFLWGL